MIDEHEELWHYRRTCASCGHMWGGLHCIHDGFQNPCPRCNTRPIPVPDASYDGCDCEFDI